MKPKILFVCSQNRWRSLTAENIFKNDPRFELRSAGTSKGARHVISTRDVEWADLILCMQEKHKQIIEEKYPNLNLPEIKVLNIGYEHEYMSPELIQTLQDKVDEILGKI